MYSTRTPIREPTSTRRVNQWDERPIQRGRFFMKYILGTKQGMTQVFTDTGVRPATVLSAGPVVVTQVKTKDKDAYEAVQVAYGSQKKQRINKARTGVFGDLGSFAHLKEFRTEAEGKERGATIDVSVFAVGDKVEVSAISKGKGFQGVVKRHGFAGGPRTHGQKHSEREPGSIGGSGGRAGGRVAKGIRMAGRMGGDRVTVKNLEVLQIDADTNTLVLSGAVPGKRGTVVEVRSM